MLENSSSGRRLWLAKILLSVGVIMFETAQASSAPEDLRQTTAATLVSRATSGAAFDYFLRLPARYSAERDCRFPLIIYLHGAGEVAKDPMHMLTWDVPARLDPEGGASRTPFVVLFPHRQEMLVAPASNDTFIDYAVSHYRIDPSRIYMVGFSAGAAQLLSYANAFPQRLAAGISIAGFWPTSGPGPMGFAGQISVCPMLATPLWFFHAQDDDRVPFGALTTLVSKLQACGKGQDMAFRWTGFAQGGHNIDTAVLNGSLVGMGEPPGAIFEPDVYSWLLQHRKD